MNALQLSVIVPAYNEEAAIGPLYKRLKPVLNELGLRHEIIIVDDGSRDQTYARIKDLQKSDPTIRIIKFRRNFGQSAAFDAGFKLVRGEKVATLDADLQNDPRDIPRMLQLLDKGYDMVIGWRHPRHDGIFKVGFSWFARQLRQALIADRVHDSGCSLKVFTRAAASSIDLVGEMHRYIPALLQLQGFKIAELKVTHHRRKFGKTKYSVGRLFRGFMDLIVVAFWRKYAVRPSHFFGGVGLFLVLAGGLMSLWLLYRKFAHHFALTQSNLPLVAVLCLVVGLQLFLFGLLADIMIRTYYKGGATYTIERIEDANPAS